MSLCNNLNNNPHANYHSWNNNYISSVLHYPKSEKFLSLKIVFTRKHIWIRLPHVVFQFPCFFLRSFILKHLHLFLKAFLLENPSLVPVQHLKTNLLLSKPHHLLAHVCDEEHTSSVVIYGTHYVNLYVVVVMQCHKTNSFDFTTSGLINQMSKWSRL